MAPDGLLDSGSSLQQDWVFGQQNTVRGKRL
jgi:hypothetical protein